MAVKIYLSGGVVKIDDGVSRIEPINSGAFVWKTHGNDEYIVRDKIFNQSRNIGTLSDIQNAEGAVFPTTLDLENYLDNLVNSGMTTTKARQGPSLVSFMAKTIEDTTLAAGAVKDDTSVTLTSVANVAIGSYIVIFNKDTRRFYQGRALNAATNPVLLDTPLDSDFPSGKKAAVAETNLATSNGSVTPEIFQLRGDQADPIDVEVAVTRFIITMLLSSAGNLAQFGNITALTKGLVLRKTDGTTYNLFNIKSNQDIKTIAGGDLELLPAVGQAPDSAAGRITFSGEDKMGNPIFIAPGENLQLINQDNLTILGVAPVQVEVMIEGYVVLNK